MLHDTKCVCDVCSTYRVVYALMVATEFGYITEKDRERTISILSVFNPDFNLTLRKPNDVR